MAPKYARVTVENLIYAISHREAFGDQDGADALREVFAPYITDDVKTKIELDRREFADFMKTELQ